MQRTCLNVTERHRIEKRPASADLGSRAMAPTGIEPVACGLGNRSSQFLKQGLVSPTFPHPLGRSAGRGARWIQAAASRGSDHGQRIAPVSVSKMSPRLEGTPADRWGWRGLHHGLEVFGFTRDSSKGVCRRGFGVPSSTGSSPVLLVDGRVRNRLAIPCPGPATARRSHPRRWGSSPRCHPGRSTRSGSSPGTAGGSPRRSSTRAPGGSPW